VRAGGTRPLVHPITVCLRSRLLNIETMADFPTSLHSDNFQVEFPVTSSGTELEADTDGVGVSGEAVAVVLATVVEVH
jgi:hypothetical protein